MRLCRIAILFLGVGLLGARARAAECTASPADNVKARAAIEAALRNSWPLPVLRGTPIDSLDGFRGALILASETVYQIEKVVWQINPNGSLGIVEFEGYTADGIRSSFSRPEAGGRRIESLSDLHGFTLGNPRDKNKLQKIDSIQFSADREGFVAISRLSGTKVKSGEDIDFGTGEQTPQPQLPCGLRVSMRCSQDTCVGGACGAAPGCPCNGTYGGCYSYTETTCFGVCVFPLICNGSVNDCKCITRPPNPPTNPPTNPPGGGGTSPEP